MWHLSWGLESGCQEVLTLMHKRFFTMDLAKKIIEETYRVGIWQSAALIVGFPGETDEMFQETVQFVIDHHKYFGTISAQPMMIVHNSLCTISLKNSALTMKMRRTFWNGRQLTAAITMRHD